MTSARRKSLFAALACGVAAGCPASAPPPPAGPPSYEGVSLRVEAIGEPPALREAAKILINDWADNHHCKAALADGQGGDWDVLVFPAERLGELMDAGRLAKLPESLFRQPAPAAGQGASSAEGGTPPAAPADVEDGSWVPGVFPEPYVRRVARYGKDLVALPYATSTLVLAYRRDAFEKPEVRQAAEQAGIKLEAPATWEELDALARFLNGQDWDGDGKPGAGLAAALKDDPRERLAGELFVARAASLGQHPDQYSFLFDYDSMEPRLGLPLFAEALKGVAGWKEAGPEGCAGFDAEAARAAFREGKAAMLLDRAEMAARWTDPANPHPVLVARLPGSARVYNAMIKEYGESNPADSAVVLPGGGGWLVGVSSTLDAKETEAAIGLAKVLAGKEAAALVGRDSAHPALSVHTDINSRPAPIPGVDSRSWSRAVLRILGSTRSRPGLRLPEAESYAADLDGAVARAAAGEAPEAVLADLTSRWSGRVAAGGKERLRWHYCRGLNDVHTEESPPAK